MKIIRQLGMPGNGSLSRDQLLRVVLIYLSLLVLPISMVAETMTGFVTRIDSPTEFEIGTMHVLITPTTGCSFEAQSRSAWSKHSTHLSPCNAAQIKIGSRIILTGEFTTEEQFVASKVELPEGFHLRESRFLLMCRQPAPGILIREALNEEAPAFKRNTQGWNGRWWIDGYPMTINTQTRLLSSTDSELLGKGYLVVNCMPIQAKGYENNVHDLNSPDLLTPNTWIIYHAKHGHGGTITANQIRLWQNKISPDEKQHLAIYNAAIRLPDYCRSIPGSIQYEHGSPIQIVPNQKTQKYISDLGMDVVPKYQKDMPTGNPTKITFRFYVIRPFVYAPQSHFLSIDGHLPRHYSSAFRYNAPRSYSSITSVISVSNGIILVPDVVLAHMQTQSQVTALLSYAITSILQKQADIACAGDIPDCFRYEDEQLLRIGIREMYLAGYDIREAPFAWAVAQGKPVNNPIIDSKDPDKEIPWYAAYAFNYISQYYSGVDYSKLKRGEAEYQQFLQELRKADPEAFAPTPQPQAGQKK